MSTFRSRLARRMSCQPVMPVPVIPIPIFPREPPKPIYPVPLPFQPKEEPMIPPAIVPMEVPEYPPKEYPKPGTILSNKTGFMPPGYLRCDGSEVSRTTYATLFSLIGTYYGEGDGSTTFHLPQLTNTCDPCTQYIIKYDLWDHPYCPPPPCLDSQQGNCGSYPMYPSTSCITWPDDPCNPFLGPTGPTGPGSTTTTTEGPTGPMGPTGPGLDPSLLQGPTGPPGSVTVTCNCSCSLPGYTGTTGSSEPYPIPPSTVRIQILPYPLAYIPPPGTILYNTFNYLPQGYLACDGAEVSRTTYSILFDMIGTYYGEGDMSTTFHLPNLSDGISPPYRYIIRSDLQVLPCVAIAPDLQVNGLDLSQSSLNIN